MKNEAAALLSDPRASSRVAFIQANASTLWPEESIDVALNVASRSSLSPSLTLSPTLSPSLPLLLSIFPTARTVIQGYEIIYLNEIIYKKYK